MGSGAAPLLCDENESFNYILQVVITYYQSKEIDYKDDRATKRRRKEDLEGDVLAVHFSLA